MNINYMQIRLPSHFLGLARTLMCKIPSPLLPHSMLNEKFQPGAKSSNQEQHCMGEGGVADGFASWFTDI